MIERKLYKETKWLEPNTYEWLLTEKLDGSNLCFFNMDGYIYVALRNYIMRLDEITNNPEESVTNKLYKGLASWLDEYGIQLEIQLYTDSAICGEWLGMGQIKYPYSFQPFNMFARARVVSDTGKLEDVYLEEFVYDPEDFGNAFWSSLPPNWIDLIPVIDRLDHAPTIKELNSIYAKYAAAVDRPVEGIVVTQKEVPNRRCKYVRMKGGKLQSHKTLLDTL